MNKRNISGEKFGRLSVVSEAGRGRAGNVLWKCLCDCGKECIVGSYYLISGNTKSCGCISQERRRNRKINLIGEKFGTLTVISDGGKGPRRESTWLCRCECGNEVMTSLGHLRSGHTKSCGCKRNEFISKVTTRHGQSIKGSLYYKEYRIWLGVKNRCTNVKNKSYARYGGRGIKMCDRWLESFDCFIEDMGPMPINKESLDRFPDNDGYYGPGNCRWADAYEQNGNRSNSRLIEFKGRKLILAEWARKLSVDSGALFTYLKRHSFEDAYFYYINKKYPNRSNNNFFVMKLN